jgi:G:T-mismatch repair DNA endonuclease (very short patch repair protein)
MGYKLEFAKKAATISVMVATVKEAEEQAKKLKQQGFRNIIIYDVETNKAVEVF